MPTDLVKRINLSKLYPPFRDRVLKVIGDLHDQGVDFYLLQGTRTVEEQDALYAQGRIAPGKVVTNARGGFSWHNYGVAVDCVFDTDPAKAGLQPSWEERWYRPLIDTANINKLQCGVPGLGDWGHLQIRVKDVTRRPEGELLALCKRKYAMEGMPGVWKLLDTYQWWE